MDDESSRSRTSADSAVHVPVMLDRCLALLAPALDGHPAVVVDATLGLGGHAEALLPAAPRADPRRPGPRPGGAAPQWRTARPLCRPDPPRARRLRPDARGARRARLRRGGRGALRPRRLLDAARRRRARLRLRPGRTAGHADGHLARHHRRRGDERVLGTRACPGAAGVRRRAIYDAHRPGHRARAGQGAADLDGRACGAGARRDSGRHPSAGWPPREAHVPGAACRGQRRTGRPARCRPSRAERAARRWPNGRDVVPVAGGPHRQAEHRGAGHGHHPRGFARTARRAPPVPQAADEGGRDRDRGRDRREPACGLSAAARGRAPSCVGLTESA